MINSWIFDVFIIKKVISAVFLSITRRCVLHLVFFQAFFVNMYHNRPFRSPISVHYATSLHCVECTKQVFFDHATSIRFVDQTFLYSIQLTVVAFSAFRMLFIDLLQQSHFSKLCWPHIGRCCYYNKTCINVCGLRIQRRGQI